LIDIIFIVFSFVGKRRWRLLDQIKQAAQGL